jgi:DNA modification methylase
LPAEKWTPPNPPTRRAGYDLVLTSPPYFDVEKYEGGEQSREKFGGYDAWRDGFYSELISRAFGWLKPGGTFALQVGSQAYPLLKDGKRLAKAAGFTIGEIRATDMANNFQGTAEENGEIVLLLHKPARAKAKAKAAA